MSPPPETAYNFRLKDALLGVALNLLLPNRPATTQGTGGPALKSVRDLQLSLSLVRFI